MFVCMYVYSHERLDIAIVIVQIKYVTIVIQKLQRRRHWKHTQKHIQNVSIHQYIYNYIHITRPLLVSHTRLPIFPPYKQLHSLLLPFLLPPSQASIVRVTTSLPAFSQTYCYPYSSHIVLTTVVTLWVLFGVLQNEKHILECCWRGVESVAKRNKIKQPLRGSSKPSNKGAFRFECVRTLTHCPSKRRCFTYFLLPLFLC